MATYLAIRIGMGKLDYSAVIDKFPQFKSGIDENLVINGFKELIVV